MSISIQICTKDNGRINGATDEKGIYLQATSDFFKSDETTATVRFSPDEARELARWLVMEAEQADRVGR